MSWNKRMGRQRETQEVGGVEMDVSLNGARACTKGSAVLAWVQQARAWQVWEPKETDNGWTVGFLCSGTLRGTRRAASVGVSQQGPVSQSEGGMEDQRARGACARAGSGEHGKRARKSMQ